MKNNSKHNNSLELIDINKLYDGLNEKMITINSNDFDEIVNNAIFKPSVKSDHDKKTININDVTFNNGAKLGDEINYLTKELVSLEDAINIIKANQKNDYNSLVKKIDNYLLPIDTSCNDIDLLKKDIKTLFDDIEDVKSDMEYKVDENDIDDKINDSSYFHDLESKVEDLEAYSNDRVELSYVESIDARLNRIECGIIGRVVNSVKSAFNTLKSVRISIKTK